MKKELLKIVSTAQREIIKNSPAILTGVGIGGFVSTIIFAIKGTKKSDDILEEHQEDLSFSEKFKLCWHNYIPMASIGTLSIACFISSNTINYRRQAALISAYTMSENLLKEYQDKVVETIGEKKESAIRDAINDDRIKNNPPKEDNIIIANSGDMLCMEAISGRYFYSDIEKIKSAENRFNEDLLLYMVLSLNDFYDYLGLEHTRMGDQVGWSLNDGLGPEGRVLIDFRHSSHLTPEQKPCLVIDYGRYPTADFMEI